MKKLLLLPLLAFMLACSTDENTIATDNSKAQRLNTFPTLPIPVCNLTVNPTVTVDVSGGLGNPVLVFTAAVTGNATKLYYRPMIVVETLLDCEDINSGSGITTVYELPATAPSQPLTGLEIEIPASQLPPGACFRWSFVLNKVSGSTVTCRSYSGWYDAPLF